MLKAGAALTIAVMVSRSAAVEAAASGAAGKSAGAAAQFVPNDFIRVSSDDVVTIVSKHLEMGQGIYTGLSTLVAEELDASWDQLRIEPAPADVTRYANLFLRVQGTGGSTSLANSFDQMRKAGAVARAMLVSAAAQRWKVPGERSHGLGWSHHACVFRSQRSLWRAGCRCVEAARAEGSEAEGSEGFPLHRQIPASRGCAPEDRRHRRIHAGRPAPGMLTAVVAYPERIGAKVASFDATKAKAVKGVEAVVAFQTPVRSGVAVIARNFWSARKGRDALNVQWDESSAFKAQQQRSVQAIPRAGRETRRPCALGWRSRSAR